MLAALAVAPGTPALEPATGLVLEDTIPLGPPDFGRPVAVAAGPLGRLYVADALRSSVLCLNAAGGVRFEFESPPGQPGIAPLDLEVTGFQVWLLDAQSKALLRFGDQGGFLDVLTSFRDLGGDVPAALAVDGTGRVLLAYPARHEVQLLDARQNLEATVGGLGARAGELARPRGVAFAAQGAFWVADTGNARLQRFTGVGNFDRAARDSSLQEPRGLVVGGAGDVFVADPVRRAVHLFGPTGVHRATLGLEPHAPVDAAVVGDTLWVLSASPPALLRVRVLRGG